MKSVVDGMTRAVTIAALAGLTLALATEARAGHRQGRALAKRYPAAMYGTAFLAGRYGDRVHGYSGRDSDGRPVFHYTKPTYYRLTIDGEPVRSQWHRWHEVR